MQGKAFVFIDAESFPDISSIFCSVDKEGKTKLMFIKYLPSR